MEADLMEAVLAAKDAVMDAVHDWKDTVASGQAGREEYDALEAALKLYGLQMRAAGLRFARDGEMPADWAKDGRRRDCPEVYGYPIGPEWCHTCRELAEVERQIQEAAHG